MKFCPNCGKDVADTAMFCEGCGHKFEGEAQQTANYAPDPAMTYGSEPVYGSEPAYGSEPTYGDPYAGGYGEAPAPKKNNKKLFVIIGAAVAAIVAIVLVFVLFTGGGPEGVFDKVEDAINDQDAEALVEVINPLETKGMDESEKLELAEKMISQYEGALKAIPGDIEVTVSFDVQSTEDLTGEDFDDLKEEYSEEGFELEEACVCTVEMTMDIDGDSEMIDQIPEEMLTQTQELVVVKVDGDWYMGGE